jgi:hypothetical protein
VCKKSEKNKGFWPKKIPLCAKSKEKKRKETPSNIMCKELIIPPHPHIIVAPQ